MQINGFIFLALLPPITNFKCDASHRNDTTIRYENRLGRPSGGLWPDLSMV